MALNLTCPECDKRVRIPDEKLGKKVRCPECEGTFVAEAELPRRSARREAPKQAPWALIIGGAVGGLLILTALGVGAVFLFKGPSDPSTSAVAQQPPTRSTPATKKSPTTQPKKDGTTPTPSKEGTATITGTCLVKLRKEMTRPDIEAMFGPGDACQAPPLSDEQTERVAKTGGAVWESRRGSKGTLYVVFPNQRSEAALCAGLYVPDSEEGRVSFKVYADVVAQEKTPDKSGADDRVTMANFLKIQIGMAESEVNDLVGRPNNTYNPFGEDPAKLGKDYVNGTVYWLRGHLWFAVDLKDGKVRSKGIIRSDQVTKATLEKVMNGMTRAEVEQVLGLATAGDRPQLNSMGMPTGIVVGTWSGWDMLVTVTFTNGKVTSKTSQTVPAPRPAKAP